MENHNFPRKIQFKWSFSTALFVQERIDWWPISGFPKMGGSPVVTTTLGMTGWASSPWQIHDVSSLGPKGHCWSWSNRVQPGDDSSAPNQNSWDDVERHRSMVVIKPFLWMKHPNYSCLMFHEFQGIIRDGWSCRSSWQTHRRMPGSWSCDQPKDLLQDNEGHFYGQPSIETSLHGWQDVTFIISDEWS